MQRDQPLIGDVREDRRAAWRLASARSRSAPALAGRQVRPHRRPGSGASRARLLPWGTALDSPAHHHEPWPCGKRENTTDTGRVPAPDGRTYPVARQQRKGSTASPSSTARNGVQRRAQSTGEHQSNGARVAFESIAERADGASGRVETQVCRPDGHPQGDRAHRAIRQHLPKSVSGCRSARTGPQLTPLSAGGVLAHLSAKTTRGR